MAQTLTLPNWHPANTANGPHGHWRTKYQNHIEAQTLAFLQARVSKWERVEGKVRLDVVFVYPRKYRVDTDNLYARVKGLVDGLKGHFFTDDSTDYLDLRVTAEVVKGVKATRITLTSAQPNGTMG